MAKRAMTPSDETKIYQDLKSRLEDEARGEVEDKTIQAGKTYSAKVAETGASAIKNPVAQKSIQRAAQATAGALGSKAASAALSGGAGLIGEFAFGVPKLFLDQYDRGQQPYEQVKYVAEFTGPLDKLEPKSLEPKWAWIGGVFIGFACKPQAHRLHGVRNRFTGHSKGFG